MRRQKAATTCAARRFAESLVERKGVNYDALFSLAVQA